MSKIATFETYRLFDPLIVEHVEPEEVIEYAAERDPKVLDLPPGVRPVLFRCRRLTRSQRSRITEAGGEPMGEDKWSARQRTMAFRFGLLEIRDIPGHSGPWSPARAKDLAQFEERGLDDLEGLGLGDVDFWEIGTVILAQSFLAAGVAPRVPLLHTSEQAWAAARHAFNAAPKTDSSTSEGSSSAPADDSAKLEEQPQTTS